jgi:hypothetical protein
MKEGRRKMYTLDLQLEFYYGIIVWLLPITQQKYQGTLHAVRKRQQQQQPTNGRLISRNHNARSPVSLLPISSQASGISFTKTFCHQKLNQRLANRFYVVNDYFFCRRTGDNYSSTLVLDSNSEAYTFFRFCTPLRQLSLIHVEHDHVH